MAFKSPNFNERCIELRCEDNEVAIYATPQGLKQIIAFCEKLLNDDKGTHIHMEDYEILTKESLIGAIALFKQ